MPPAGTLNEILYCLILKTHINVKLQNNKKYIMSLEIPP